MSEKFTRRDFIKTLGASVPGVILVGGLDRLVYTPDQGPHYPESGKFCGRMVVDSDPGPIIDGQFLNLSGLYTSAGVTRIRDIVYQFASDAKLSGEKSGWGFYFEGLKLSSDPDKSVYIPCVTVSNGSDKKRYVVFAKENPYTLRAPDSMDLEQGTLAFYPAEKKRAKDGTGVNVCVGDESVFSWYLNNGSKWYADVARSVRETASSVPMKIGPSVAFLED